MIVSEGRRPAVGRGRRVAVAREARGGGGPDSGPCLLRGYGWFHELADSSGCGVTHEVRPHRPAEGMDRRPAPVNEHGDIAGRCIRQGHDRDSLRHRVSELRRIAKVENLRGVRPWFVIFSPQQHLARCDQGIVGDQDQVGPRPRLLDGTSGSPQGACALAHKGEGAPRSEGDQPCPAVVLPHG